MLSVRSFFGQGIEDKLGINKIKSVSTCLRNTHVHGELEIPKFYFVAPQFDSRANLLIIVLGKNYNPKIEKKINYNVLHLGFV